MVVYTMLWACRAQNVALTKCSIQYRLTCVIVTGLPVALCMQTLASTFALNEQRRFRNQRLAAH